MFLQGSRLAERTEKCWRVLELGFGTGLNFAVTAQTALQAGRELHYESLEPEPLEERFWLVDEVWRSGPWDAPRQHQGIKLTIHRSRWQDFPPLEPPFQALYHDPFGPAQNPDCWTPECFAWGASSLSPDGVLATFGASTRARQAMQRAGLHVAVLPGAVGKREMTAASKSLECLDHGQLWRPSPRHHCPLGAAPKL